MSDELKPAFSDELAAVYVGDCLDVLRRMLDESVHCVVTSPPYFGLRDYGTAEWDISATENTEIAEKCDHKMPPMGGTVKGATLSGPGNREGCSGDGQYRDVCGKCGAVRVDRQIGLEATPQLFVAKMVEVFAEVRRVLRADGTLWLNLGDSYWTDSPGKQNGGPIGPTAAVAIENNRGVRIAGLKPKDLLGMPWRVAFALQEAGWWLRQDIIWAKPNPMPESVTDRCTKAHEYIFLLAKSAKYFYDAEAVKEQSAVSSQQSAVKFRTGDAYLNQNGPQPNGRTHRKPAGWDTGDGAHGSIHRDGRAQEIEYTEVRSTARNKRSVWEVTTAPFAEAHFATFPPKLIEPCILAGTSEKGVCAACGSPWVRVVEKSGGTIGKGSWIDHDKEDEQGQSRAFGPLLDRDRPWDNGTYKVETLGWRKSCKCETDETVPATVLDPFAGAGTTLLVAKRHGRRSIGIELNPEYADIIRRRLEHYHKPAPPKVSDAAPGPLFDMFEEAAV